MKKIFKALKFPIVLLLVLLSFIACDKDFNIIESEVLGADNTNFSTGVDTINAIAYNKRVDAVQINNLPSYLLGVFNDPEYGKTTASIVTQLTPTTASLNEDFGINTTLDSVIINIPYFSSIKRIDEDGNTEYQLDSLYGNPDLEYKLTIYKNNYFLRDFDPFGEVNSSQNYYSKAEDNPELLNNYALNGSQNINFDVHKGEVIIDTVFAPSTKPIILTTGEGTDKIVTSFAPAFRYSINPETQKGADQLNFWKQAIVLKGGSDDLSSANNFRNYFRGFYLKSEPIDDNGNMILMNLASSEANVTLYYTKGDTSSRTSDQFVMNFSGNTLNTFNNEFIKTIEGGDATNGDETLYLKGMEGSMAVVNLFGTEDSDNNMVPDELDDLLMDYRKTDANGDFIKDSSGNYVLKRLLNEAHLIIYEDGNEIVNTVDDNGDSYHKYDRIYAYDIENNTPTLDYQIDPTQNNEPFFSKTFSLGQRVSNSSSDPGKYKIRLTEHLNNIIQRDSTNYQIGLVLSNNVNFTNNSEILNGDDVTGIPAATILSPRGTILKGSNEANGDERLLLKVFFTELKDN